MARAYVTLPRLTLATILLAGCFTGRAGDPPAALPAAWSVPNCLIEDTTAPTADTLYIVDASSPAAGARYTVGEARLADGPRDTPMGCSGRRDRATPSGPPVLVPLAAPAGMDLRDVLEMGALAADGHRVQPDILVSRDPDLIAYAERRGFLVSALPWGRTYLLAVASPAHAGSAPTQAERDGLARNAVTASARGAAEPFPWWVDSSCVAIPKVRRTGSTAAVAYALGDATSRQLAERVVSLARMQVPPNWIAAAMTGAGRTNAMRAIAMPADSIVSALDAGEVAVAVVAIARDPRTRCGTRGNAPVPAGAVPLIDGRAHVVIRRGSGAVLLVGPDGTFRIVRRTPR